MEILKKHGKASLQAREYKLALTSFLEDFHDVFHISILRKVVRELELIIRRPQDDLKPNMSIRLLHVRIIGHKVIETTSKVSRMVKIQWERDGIQEYTLETEHATGAA